MKNVKIVSTDSATGTVTYRYTKPLPWIVDAAKELVISNNDRGRYHDNSPTEEETVAIIHKHFGQWITKSTVVVENPPGVRYETTNNSTRRSDKELLGILDFLVGQSEGTDFLSVGECGLTKEEIDYIRSLADARTQ